LLVVGFAALSGSRPAAQEDPIKWSFGPKIPTKAKAGDVLKVELVARIDETWHLYSVTQPPPPIATRITVPAGQPFSLGGSIDAPSPRVAFDENFGIDAEYYSESASFTLPVKVAAGTTGAQKLRVQAYYQTCNNQLCMPPKTVTIEATIEVSGGSGAASPTTVAPAGEGAIQPVARAAQAPPQAADVRPPAPPQAVRSSAGGASAAAPPSEPAPPSAPQSSAPASAASGASAPAASAAAATRAGVELDLRTSNSLLSFVWLAMTVGALSLLTPCVFPMVPITVSFFTSRAAGSRKKAIGQAFTYMAGIILTFTAIGMAMALLVGATSLNRFAASPWVNLLIAALFVGFALALFGFYEIQIPSGLLNRIDRLTRQSGGSDTIATLVMALTFTLTSFTCTAPFIGTLLVMAAGGDWQWPLVGMLAFSTVFALPFFILALMPQWLARLPRSGGWMNSIKVMMAFLVAGASMKYIANVDVVWGWGIFTRDVVLGSWVTLALLMMAYILGMFRFAHDSPVKHVGITRLATALTCGTLAFWLASGLTGKRLGELEAFLPLSSGTPLVAAGAGAGGELTWLVNDYEGALAEAQRTNRRIFIDFTGYTCTNCKWMETNMFPRPEVQHALERYVRVKLYTDGNGELFERQQAIQQGKYKTVAVPYYAIVDSSGNAIVSFPGLTRDPQKFISFLQMGLEDAL
jgi:thiol:disulfide interchange protein DsbD